MASTPIELTCTNALVNAASKGMRDQMSKTIGTVTKNSMADTGGALHSLPKPMYEMATFAKDIDLIDVPVLVAVPTEDESLTPLRSVIGDFVTRLCTAPWQTEAGALSTIISAYIAIAQISQVSIPKLSEHIEPTGIRLRPIYTTLTRFRCVTDMAVERGLASAEISRVLALKDDADCRKEATALCASMNQAKDQHLMDLPEPGAFGEWAPFVDMHHSCTSRDAKPKDDKLATLVSFELMLIAEAKRSPGPEAYDLYMSNRKTAVLGLLGKETLDIVVPSFAFSVESSRRSGVSGHLRQLYLDLLASAAQATFSATLSQSASWTMSTIAFTGMTAVSVVIMHIARPCPEVLGWALLTGEVISLERGMVECFAPQWSATGSDGEGWRWPFSQYLRIKGAEALSWSRLHRLAQAAIVIAAMVSPSLRRVSLSAGEKQLKEPDRYISAIIDYVSRKIGSHSVILGQPSENAADDAEEKALASALAVRDTRPVVAATTPLIEEVAPTE